MPKLTLSEAKALASVFGSVDHKKSILLMLFYRPRSKYDTLRIMKRELPLKYQIPRASLYRLVDEMNKSGYVRPLSTRAFKKGRLKQTVTSYGLSLKGYLAAVAFAYVLFLDKDANRELRKDGKSVFNSDALVEQLESTPLWNFHINFLRWNCERKNDLSNVSVDALYILLTWFVSLVENPEVLDEQDLTESLNALKSAGLNIPQVEPKTILLTVRKMKKAADEFAELFLPVHLRKQTTNPISDARS